MESTSCPKDCDRAHGAREAHNVRLRGYEPERRLGAELEHRIIERVVDAAVTAGWACSVDSGPLMEDKDAILEEVFQRDDVFLALVPPAGASAEFKPSWIRFVQGNEATVISDYSTQLERTGFLTEADEVASRYL